MIMADDTNVVRLKTKGAVQPSTAQRSTASDDITIKPKSLLSMTDVELQAFLLQLRERRMKAVRVIKQAADASHSAKMLSNKDRMERKVAAAEKQLAKVDAALEKLEEYVRDLRAMQINYTNVPLT